MHSFDFNSTSKTELRNKSQVSFTLQVAFIISGEMHSTYDKVLSLGLGLEGVCRKTFYDTIEYMYPVVTQMVNDMCEQAKQQMKEMDRIVPGSWKKAITEADCAWLTREYHSKNATFRIRNHQNGSLLYYEHICQRGKEDNIIKNPLYPGTSKSAEGYAANVLFERAKNEGMLVETQWQDGDSSSANQVNKHFPKARIMICAGHASKSHKKVLEGLAKAKSFTKDFIKSHTKKYPQVVDVKCHCTQNTNKDVDALHHNS